MSQEPEKVIKSLFAKIQKIPLEQVDMNADLFEVYKVDSLRAVKLLSSLEVEMEIELPDAMAGKFRTLNDVLSCVKQILAGESRPAANG